MTGSFDRYHRQTLLPQIGSQGQQRLGRSRVLLVGCGALGCAAAALVVRAGVGFIRIADRDIVELTNLQRQVLFDEADAADETPKAIAAANRLRRINSAVTIEPHVLDVHAQNVEELAGLERGQTPVDLILDGTDNVATRYLLNDVSVKHGIPWIYAACIGTEGRCLAVRPGATACLRCLFPDPPPAAELPTCDTAGVLGPAAAMAASLQVTAALKILLEQRDALAPLVHHRCSRDATIAEPGRAGRAPGCGTGPPGHGYDGDQPKCDGLLVSFDLWQNRFRTISADAPRPDCITCGQRRFEFLDTAAATRSLTLCGRNAVQIQSAGVPPLDLSRLAGKLSAAGSVQLTPYLLRCDLIDPKGTRLTVFPDGRALIQGTTDFERARSIYARFIGS
jgi:adenylyltransferase/sulfurtransferase